MQEPQPFKEEGRKDLLNGCDTKFYVSKMLPLSSEKNPVNRFSTEETSNWIEPMLLCLEVGILFFKKCNTYGCVMCHVLH